MILYNGYAIRQLNYDYWHLADYVFPDGRRVPLLKVMQPPAWRPGGEA